MMLGFIGVDQINIYDRLRKTGTHNWPFNIVFGYFIVCVVILNGCLSF